MRTELYQQIKNHPEFNRLVRQRSAWAWGLTLVILVMYFAFILLIAFAPSWLAQPVVAGSVITRGIPVGLFIIVAAFVLTGCYVYQANTRFDQMTQKIMDDLGQ